MSKMWFTAKEVADIGAPGTPSTTQGVLKMAAVLDWNSDPLKYRRRKGIGGGYEYHLSVLPLALQTFLAVRNLKSDCLNRPIFAEATIDASVSTSQAGLRRDAKLAILLMWNKFRHQNIGSIEFAQYSFTTLYNAQNIEGLPEWVYQTVKTVSPRTLNNWQKKQTSGETGALGGGYGNRKGSGLIDTAFGGAVAKFIETRIVNQPHLSATIIRKRVRAEFGDHWEVVDRFGEVTVKPLPNLRNFQRWIGNYRDINHEVLMKMNNPDGWKNKYQVAIGKANAWVKSPNHLWEIDASPADVLCTDGRYVIYLVVDIYTRRIKVSVSKTATTAASLMLIRQAILDWGVPGTIREDNGSDFVSHQGCRALLQLGIGQDICPPFTPEDKGTVERHIGTLQRGFMEMLESYIGHDVEDRKKIEARKSFAIRLGETDKNASAVDLSHTELQHKIDQWVEHVYSHDVHGGLNGKTPFEMAATWGGTLKRIENEASLNILLAEAPGKEGFRTVTKKGIRIGGLGYWGSGLRVGERVFVRHDPEDLGRILCFTDDTRDFICEAHNAEAAGLDPLELARMATEEQKRRMSDEVIPLKRRIKKINKNDMIDAVLKDGRKRNGDLIAFPTKSIAYSTRDLEAIEDAITPSDPTYEQQLDAVRMSGVRQKMADVEQANIDAERAAEMEREQKEINFDRAMAIEETLAAGGEVSSIELMWHGRYSRSSEYGARKRMRDFENSG